MKKFIHIVLTCFLFITCLPVYSQISTFPNTTDFESGFGDWNQSSSDNFDWTLRSSATTPSSGTGPQSGPYGANGTSGYAFTESSSPRTNNDVARIFITLDLSSYSSCSISFNYHQYSSYGYGPGTLRLKVYKGNSGSGGTVDYPWSNSSSVNGWQSAVVDLSNYVGYSYVQLSFESILPSTGTCWQSDNCVDEIVIDASSCVNAWNGSANDGDWNNTSNWTCGTVPSPSENITIASNAISYPALTSSVTVNSLTLDAGTELNITNPLAILTVNGNFSSGGIVNIVDGKLDITGTADFNRGATIVNGEIEVDGATTIGSGYVLDIGDGTFDANGNFDATVDPPTFPNADINFGNSGKLTLAGTTNYLGDLSTSSGTVEYDGSTQTIVTDTYHNIEVDGAGTKTLGGNITVGGDVTISNGVMDIASHNLTIGGNFSTIQYGFEEGSGTVTFNGSNSHNVTHNGSSESVSSQYNSLTESFPNGTPTHTWTTTTIMGNAWSIDASGFAYYYYSATSAAFSGLWSESINLNAGDQITINWKDRTGGYTEKYALLLNTATSHAGATTLYDNSGFSTTSWTSRSVVYTIQTSGTYHLGFLCYSDADMFYLGIDDVEMDVDGTIASDVAGKLNNFTMNGDGDVTLSSPLTVNGTLTLTNGDVITSSTNYLKLGKNGSVSGGDNDSHIVGDVKKETESTSSVTIPVGDGNLYRPVVITPVNATNETWSIKYYNTAHSNTTMGTGLHHVSQYYWDISRSGSNTATLSFDWDASYAVDVPVDLRMSHFNGTEWEELNTTISGVGGSGQATASTGRITATANSFSPFGFGSSSSGNALPIELMSFTGMEDAGNVRLDWEVASQNNNDYFTVEKSTDFTDWEEIGKLPGAGNTSQHMSYTLYDERPLVGHNYYRLTQTDYDGMNETFHPIVVTIKGERKEVVKVYNQIGQEVSIESKGLVILLWDNGDITKTIND